MGRQNPGIEKKTGTGIITGIEIKEGTGTERGNGIATTDIIGIGRNTETVLTTMIITEAVILKGEETAKEMATGGIVLDQGAGIADLDLVLVQEGITGSSFTGMFPNMLLPFGVGVGGQFNPLVIQPQAMTQQVSINNVPTSLSIRLLVMLGVFMLVAFLHLLMNRQWQFTLIKVMAAIGGNTAGPGDAVLNVYINHDKKFAFVEMRSVEEASNAIALDGILFEGAPVKPSPNLNLSAVGLTAGSAGGLEGPDRIFVGGLPYYFTEAQVRELLESFGPLCGFDLVKDRETGNSKGYAFCVYQDLNVTDIACAALNGIKMGDKTLTVKRANQGEQESILLQAQQQVQLQSCSCEQKLVYQVGALPTKVVCLTQVVSADELKDDEDGQPVAGVGKMLMVLPKQRWHCMEGNSVGTPWLRFAMRRTNLPMRNTMDKYWPTIIFCLHVCNHNDERFLTNAECVVLALDLC
ncbi:unnamed protein product [Miscanthus lutarioriparius]|uniref:RRM domain-containing protein n=1 Tax=Miscanthus lutarioriparius TaxID=422564 RepID=A0A811QIQ8_9POAL|nr:unnamed protein product [Miscanthus lutarioriparius]